MTSPPSPSGLLRSAKRVDYLEWNDYFMAIAVLSAKRSKDPVTQVGAVIVDDENRIISIGYNGLPRKCSDDQFPWYKQSSLICNSVDNDSDRLVQNSMHDKGMFVVHAEANAILNKNSANLKNTLMYTTLYPCNECAKLIIQCGITKIYYISNKYKEKCKFQAACLMFQAAGIECIQYKPTRETICLDLEAKLRD